MDETIRNPEGGIMKCVVAEDSNDDSTTPLAANTPTTASPLGGPSNGDPRIDEGALMASSPSVSQGGDESDPTAAATLDATPSSTTPNVDGPFAAKVNESSDEDEDVVAGATTDNQGAASLEKPRGDSIPPPHSSSALSEGPASASNMNASMTSDSRHRTTSQLQLSVQKGKDVTADPNQLLSMNDDTPVATASVSETMEEKVQEEEAPLAHSIKEAEGTKKDAPPREEETNKNKEAEDDDDAVPQTEEEAEKRQKAEEKKWRDRAKHIFILSYAGKPIFTRYGDESDFSELFGILQVLVSMAGSTGGGNDILRRVSSSGGHSIYFHSVQEVLYVMVTRTEESPKACIKQLKLIHNQLLSVVPTVNAVLAKNAGFDIRRLFSHADIGVMQSLIKRMSTDLTYYFRALHPVALPTDFRSDIDAILRDAYGGEDHYYSFLFYRGKVVALVCPPKQPLHPDDVLLLMNFTHCVATSQGGEVWAPICLPKFNDTGYLWCYTSNVSIAARLRGAVVGASSTAFVPDATPDAPTPEKNSGGGGSENDGRSSSPVSGGQSTILPNTDSSRNGSFKSKARGELAGGDGMLLVQLATNQEYFPELSACGAEVTQQLIEKNLISEIETIAEHSTLIQIDDGVFGRAEDVLFFVYVSDATSQLVMTEMPPQMTFSKTSRKEVFRLFIKLRDKLFQASKASLPLLIHNTEQYNVLVEKTAGGEAFLVCLPGTAKKAMVSCANSALRWIKARESSLMITKTTHWPQ